MKCLYLACCAAFLSCSDKSGKLTDNNFAGESHAESDNNLLKKIDEGRSAYQIAVTLDSIILDGYNISGLTVAVGDRSIKVSGIASSEEDKKAVENLIRQHIDTTSKVITNEITVD